MKETKQKNNYFQINSTIIYKVFWIISSIFFALASVIIAVGIFARSESHIDPQCKSFLSIVINILVAVEIVVFIAFLAVVIYNYAINHWDTDEKNLKLKEVESPLLGAAKDHEPQIIEMLKSVALPLPGKKTFNTARVGHFMRALAELGYIDSNLDGKYWKPWVETVTGFTGDTTGHVNAAYKKATIKDEKVADLCKQLQQIIGK